MASTKKLQKAATAALDSALSAVDDARKGVKALAKADGTKKTKKARGSVEDALDTAASKISAAEKATTKAVKKAAASSAGEAPTASSESAREPAPQPTKSHEQVEAEVARKSVVPTTGAPKGPEAAYTPPLPHADETTVTAHDGSEAQVDLHAQTLVALRGLATDKGVTGVSRLTKAQLIEKLQA